MKLTFGMVLGCALLMVSAGEVAMSAQPPAAPKVSSLAPANDIVAQIDRYVGELDQSVADQAAFSEAEAKVAKDSNTLILLALAAGLHDEDNKYKAAAPAIIQAAQEVAKAKGFAATQKGVAAVKKALETTAGSPAELKWVKSAALPELMKQVPLVNTRLKRNLRGEKFKTKAKDNSGDAATMAVIAQGSLADTSEAKSDEEATKWFGFCAQMRDAAAALNKAVHAKDSAAADKALANLNQSCEDCHAVFKKSEVAK